jgi:hypothetical protein
MSGLSDDDRQRLADEHLAEVLKILKERYDNGDKTTLLSAMHHCALMRKLWPEWLRLAFLRAYETATAYDIKSWDEAFGLPHPKGTHHDKEKKHRELAFLIWECVQRLKSKGHATDKALFELVGKELGIKPGITEAIYYKKQNQELYALLDTLDAAKS